MARKSVPFAVDLLISLVGLVVATTIVLTVGAYRSFHAQLEDDASRLVRESAAQMAAMVSDVVEMHAKQAQGFVTRVTTLCGEPTSAGAIAWELGCVRSALAEYRLTEHARGALFQYRDRLIARTGYRPPVDLPLPNSFARIVPRLAARGESQFALIDQRDRLVRVGQTSER